MTLFQQLTNAVISSTSTSKPASPVDLIYRLISILKRLVSIGLGLSLGYYFQFLVKYYVRQKLGKNPLPPGPLPLPIIGSLHLMATQTNPDGNPAVHKVLMNLGKKYKGLFGFYLGSVYTIVITDPAVAEEAYTVHETFSGHAPKGNITTDRCRNQSHGGNHVETMRKFTRNGQGIAMSTGNYWIKVRGRTVANITNASIAKKNEHIVREEVQSMLAHWKRKIQRDEAIDDLLLQLKRESLNICFRMLFSKRFKPDDEEMKVIADLVSYFFHNLASGNPADVMPIFGYLPNKFLIEFQKKVDIRDGIVHRIVMDRRKSFDELRAQGKMKSRSDARDILDMFLFDQVDGFEMKNDATGEFRHTKLTQDEVEICMWDLIFAFGDTTAATNQNFIYYMINNPDVQQRVHEEFDRVIGPNRLPRLEDKDNLPYFWATLKEVFRIRLVSPLMAPHYNKEDMILHDTENKPYFIPRGTSIFLHGYSMALDEKYWKDPLKFDPSRWFSPENEGLDLYGQEKRAKVDHYKFVPFSMGPRMCPGYAFAKVAQFLQTATIMHCLKWKLSPNAFDLNSKLPTSHLVDGKLDTTENFGLSNFMINHSDVGLISAETRPAIELVKSQPGDIDYSDVFLNKDEQKPIKLLKRINLSPDSAILRFSLGHPNKVLGLPVGKHFKLVMPNLVGVVPGQWNSRPDEEHGKEMVLRSYTPTSADEDAGHVDLLVKFYLPNVKPQFPDGGKVSRQLNELMCGDDIFIQGPFGRVEYKGRGVFKIGSKVYNKKFVGMMAGGSGITPMLQVLRFAFKDDTDQTQFGLIYANQTEEDILVRNELEKLAEIHGKSGRFRLHFTLDRPSDGWKYSKGFITDEMISKNLPGPGEDTIVLMCGPPPMIKFACRANLDKLGYSKESQIEF